MKYLRLAAKNTFRSLLGHRYIIQKRKKKGTLINNLKPFFFFLFYLILGLGGTMGTGGTMGIGVNALLFS